MVGSDAVIGGLEGEEVAAYSLQSKSIISVVKQPFASWLQSGSVTRTGGDTFLEFSRTIAGGNVKVDIAKKTTLVVAYHASSTALTHHSERQFMEIDLDQTPIPPETGVPETYVPVVQPIWTPLPPSAFTRTPQPPASDLKCPQSYLSMNLSEGMVWETGAPGLYTCTRMLEPDISLHWKSNESGNGMHFALATRALGWSGISFPTGTIGQMGPAHAVLQVGAVAGKFLIDDKRTPNSATPQVFDILEPIHSISAETVNDMSDTYHVLRFYLDSKAQGLPGQYEDNRNVLNFNYAFHALERDVREGHTGRGSVSLDLTTGTGIVNNGNVPADNRHKAAVHGVTLAFVWAFLVPVGVLVQKFGRTVFQLDLNVWGMPLHNLVHTVVMILAAVLTFTSVGFALTQFNRGARYGHKGLGISVISFLALQLVLPLLRTEEMRTPRNPAREIFRIVHILLSILIVLLSYVQIATGIANYNELYPTNTQITGKIMAGFFVSIAFLTLSFVLLKVRRRTMAERPRQDSIETIKNVHDVDNTQVECQNR